MDSPLRFRLVVAIIFTAIFLSACEKEFPPAPLPFDYNKELKLLRGQIADGSISCAEMLGNVLGREWPQKGDGLKGLEIELVSTDEAIGADTVGYTTGGGNWVTIQLRLQLLISKSNSLGFSLCHELVHAYLRRFMDRYSSLPGWAKEGAAVFLAGQTEYKLYVKLHEDFDNPLKFINGLESKRHGADDYLEDALAFEFLEEAYGISDQVLRSVIAGTKIYKAIEKYTGLRKSEFLAAARDYAFKRILTAKNELSEIFRAKADIAHARFDRATERMENLLRQSDIIVRCDQEPKKSLTAKEASAIRVLANLYRLKSDTTEKSLCYYKALLRTIPPYLFGNDMDSVRYELAHVLLKLNKPKAALNQYLWIYTQHINSPMLRAASTLGIAKSYFALKDYKNSIRWLEPQKRSNTYVDYQVGYLLGLSYFHTCKNKKALSILTKVANANTKWSKMAQQALDDFQNKKLYPEACEKKQ